MKTWRALSGIIAIVGLGVTAAGPAMAADDATAREARLKPARSTLLERTTEGAVTSVSDEQLEIRTKDGRMLQLAVNPSQTEVVHHGNNLGLDELNVGASVRVRHAPEGGKELARSIEVIDGQMTARRTRRSGWR